MKTTNDIIQELIDRDTRAEELEALVADIKATTYSPFSNDWVKIKFIKKAIEKAGF
jgi:hypothetical protein